ncbi:MAG: DUF493 domain-containing protein [Methylovulum sp.]|jgi:putative lipoic acid-binding regulatory protein|nr:DUF493 domain-containing protein [Methylovulum sp.]
MNQEETLFEFPCQFPIKAMGKKDSALTELVVAIINRHEALIFHETITTRLSKGGNYWAVTITIEATSKKQLDAIYQDLTDHPHVLVAL